MGDKVIAAEDMPDEAFALHIKFRHPGARAILAPPDDVEGHEQMHDEREHAHYHAEPRVE